MRGFRRSWRRRGAGVVFGVVALAAPVVPAQASGVAYPDGEWSEAWISSPSSAGEATLHADVLRPKGLAPGEKTPVILSIGPYFNHSGQTGPAGAVEGTPYDPIGPNDGPSERFQDFVEGSGLLKKGYTFVMVDLRGFGGSTGCLDWSGPGEKADVVNAVQWAANQPWSTGRVGMYGKSYDGLTGLVGVNERPPGLAAVVSQEPVYDDYRYLYGDGMRRTNSVATPALYDGIAASPGPITDDPGYNLRSLNDPLCLGKNLAQQSLDDRHDSEFWKQRNLIPGATGSNVPLFLAQGLTENNTVADGMQEYLANHTGYERSWMGPWEHVRGNETDENGRLKMGRQGWFDEVMRFYDRFLKDQAPTVADPPHAVQTNDGRWRSEAQWPPADVREHRTPLIGGSYVDTAQSVSTAANSSSGDPTDPTVTSGVWTVSQPLPHDAHLSGSPEVSVDVTTTRPNANLVVDVYDLGPDGTGPLITRQGHLVREPGESTVPLTLWGADWKLPAGHRIGVRVTDNNRDWWQLAAPSGQTVEVRGGSIDLPFLTYRRTGTVQGDPGVQLPGYLEQQIAAGPTGSAEFALPAPLADPPPGSVFTGDYVEPVGGN
ncbi:CocE/NonD family hydrolase [Saccharopolyspora sp. TS4A08]|uniref:CocE/NonD family hydrolase n=1 Tax=Saccharopolyspora ipomoeae TaxID=3042027 RepID=A0ABT6PR37_9PSEU|nr:CocE/NonD family hydrolase [Saccharopolyspora sp. TS4A08]MDI2030471.1 CocE/NonD family hydrolase [Saccharopolyspora sp. TS4A08]